VVGNGQNRADISVVIPAFNAAGTLPVAFQSVTDQTMLPDEIIVIDDASTDGTSDVIEDFSVNCPDIPVRVIRHDHNLGPGTGRNAGWDMASCKYIAFLDADDVWHPDKIRIQYKWMEEHPDYGLSGHACPMIRRKEELSPYPESLQKSHCISRWRLLFSNQFSTPSVMLRRSLPYRFAAGKRYAEDYLLWAQLVVDGVKAAYLHQPLAGMFKPAYGHSGLSSQLWLMEQGALVARWQLFCEGRIGFPLFVLITICSLLKYARRVIRISCNFI